MGSLGLFLQCTTSTFFSLLMSRLVCVFGSRLVYLSSMVCFTLSAFIICLSKNVLLVTTMSAMTGFAYATLQTLPYTLICQYHVEKEVRLLPSLSPCNLGQCYLIGLALGPSFPSAVTLDPVSQFITPSELECRKNIGDNV